MKDNIVKLELKGAIFSDLTRLDFFISNDKHEISTLIFGRNGSGKSTIAKAFRKLKCDSNTNISEAHFLDQKNSRIDLSDEEKSKIHVFDEDFVDKKVKLQTDGLDTIVMLGEKADLTNKLEKIKNDIDYTSKEEKNKKSEVSEYEKKIKEYSDKIEEKLRDENDGWASRDREIKNNRTNSRVSNQTYKKFSSLKSNKTRFDLIILFDKLLSEKKESENGEKQVNEKVPTFKIYTESYYNNLKKLLEFKIENPKVSAREEKLIKILQKSQNGSENLNKKLEFFEGDAKECPYCYQSLSEEYKNNLITTIRNVLNQEVQEHQDELRNFKLNYLNFELNSFSDIDGYNEALNHLKKFNSDIEYLNMEIDKKISNPYDPINLNSINVINDQKKLNMSLNNLENNRLKYNKSKKDTSKLVTKLDEINSDIAFLDIIEYVKKMKLYSGKKDIEDKNEELISVKLTNLKEQKKDLEAARNNIKLAIDKMNDFINYIFFSKNRLQLIYNDKKQYALLSRGKSVAPHDISQGERNIIGLCYFFVNIMKDKDEKEVYNDDYIIVIDDPISSFDMENKIGILSFLKYILNEFLSANKDTKVIILTHDLIVYYDLDKIMKEFKSSYKYINFGGMNKKITSNGYQLIDNKLKKLDIGKYQQYNEFLLDVYNFANGDNEDKLIIGNIMRQLLEAFSTFEYMKGIEEISTNSKILNTLPTEKCRAYFSNLMYRLVLNGGSHKQDAVNSMKDLNFFTLISTEEKIKTAKDILSFLYLLNSNHILFHFSIIDKNNYNQIIDKIKSWCLEIDENINFNN